MEHRNTGISHSFLQEQRPCEHCSDEILDFLKQVKQPQTTTLIYSVISCTNQSASKLTLTYPPEERCTALRTRWDYLSMWVFQIQLKLPEKKHFSSTLNFPSRGSDFFGLLRGWGYVGDNADWWNKHKAIISFLQALIFFISFGKWSNKLAE